MTLATPYNWQQLQQIGASLLHAGGCCTTTISCLKIIYSFLKDKEKKANKKSSLKETSVIHIMYFTHRPNDKWEWNKVWLG